MKIDKNEVLKKVKGTVNNIDSDYLKIKASHLKNTAIDVSSKVGNKTKNAVLRSKKEIIDKMDLNNDGSVDIEDVIILGLRTPGVRIGRDEFLKKELTRKFSPKVVKKAIETTPSQAGITIKELDPIVDNVIKYERNRVSGISAALGVPGGVSMVATLPADIVQYYGYMLRATQELMYLYSFSEIDLDENNGYIDAETMNVLILCFGVMYGVQGANTAIKALASGFAKGISNKIMRTAITKGTIYPIIKSISNWFGVHMTKDVLCGVVKKSVPVVGGFIGGGLTFLTFKPCCDKLKDSLKDTLLSDPNHVVSNDEIKIIECIEEEDN